MSFEPFPEVYPPSGPGFQPLPAKVRVHAKPGRVSTYKEIIADRVCELIADGHTLRQIAKMPGMPSKGTVRNWRINHADFRAKYALAKEFRAEDRADEIIEILFEPELAISADSNGKEQQQVAVSPSWEARKARVAVLKWLMICENPGRYGRTGQQCRAAGEGVGKPAQPAQQAGASLGFPQPSMPMPLGAP
jgi:hypothetical protein